MKKQETSKGTNKVLILLGIAMIGVAVFGLLSIFSEYQKASAKYKSLENDFVIKAKEKEDSDVTGVGGEIPW